MTEKKLDVVSVGCLAVDYFALVPEVPGPDEKIMAEGYEVHPGGVSGNVLTQTARLGLRSGWMGKVGDDEPGKTLLHDLDKEGIDRSRAIIVGGGKSMFTWIQVNRRGERSITMLPNVLVTLSPWDVEEYYGDYIASSRVFHAESCVLPFAPVIRAMEIARENGVKVILDLDVPLSYVLQKSKQATEGEIKRALELTDVLVPCKGAARELIGGAGVDRAVDLEGGAASLLALGPGIVSITLGSRGCVVADRSGSWTVPAFPVKVVDTTGAGDAFHGGFIYGLLSGLSLRETAAFANACGAICCTRVGARAVETLGGVRNFMERAGKDRGRD